MKFYTKRTVEGTVELWSTSGARIAVFYDSITFDAAEMADKLLKVLHS